jgi:hypothetical protein
MGVGGLPLTACRPDSASSTHLLASLRLPSGLRLPSLRLLHLLARQLPTRRQYPAAAYTCSHIGFDTRHGAGLARPDLFAQLPAPAHPPIRVFRPVAPLVRMSPAGVARGVYES